MKRVCLRAPAPIGQRPARREASTPIGMVKIIGHKMGTTHSV